MSTILVIDDEPFCRELMSAVLAGEGHRTLCASNAMQALLLLASEHFDLALLDVRLPGMDGLKLFETLRNTPAWCALPVILLTEVADKSLVLKARELHVKDYVLKSRFVMADFLARVRKYLPRGDPPTATAVLGPALATDVQSGPDGLGPSPVDNRRGVPTSSGPSPAVPGVAVLPRLTRDETLQRIRQYAEPRTLAGVVAEVIGITRSTRTNASDLAGALSRDPLLAARVLEVANSVAFAGGKVHTASLDDAVTKIGFATVQKIAARVGIFDVFPPQGADGFNMVRGWQHSFAVGALMDVLGDEPEESADGMAHLVGLCHDLGKLVLRQLFCEEYACAARIAAATDRAPREVEAETFGVEYSELVSEVLGTIGLPAEIVTPIQQSLLYEIGQRGGAMCPLARMLLVANSYAHGMLLATSVECRVRPFSRAECRDAPGAMRSGAVDPGKLRAEVLTMTHLLARLSAADVGQLSKPLIEPQNARLWYTPHKSFVALDPLGAALQFLAHSEVHERLPAKPGDLESCVGMVVAAPRMGSSPLTISEIEGVRRATGRGDLPVLCLAGDIAGPVQPPPAQVTLLQYPLSLARIAQWIAGL